MGWVLKTFANVKRRFSLTNLAGGSGNAPYRTHVVGIIRQDNIATPLPWKGPQTHSLHHRLHVSSLPPLLYWISTELKRRLSHLSFYHTTRKPHDKHQSLSHISLIVSSLRPHRRSTQNCHSSARVERRSWNAPPPRARFQCHS